MAKAVERLLRVQGLIGHRRVSLPPPTLHADGTEHPYTPSTPVEPVLSDREAKLSFDPKSGGFEPKHWCRPDLPAELCDYFGLKFSINVEEAVANLIDELRNQMVSLTEDEKRDLRENPGTELKKTIEFDIFGKTREASIIIQSARRLDGVVGGAP